MVNNKGEKVRLRPISKRDVLQGDYYIRNDNVFEGDKFICNINSDIYHVCLDTGYTDSNGAVIYELDIIEFERGGDVVKMCVTSNSMYPSGYGLSFYGRVLYDLGEIVETKKVVNLSI